MGFFVYVFLPLLRPPLRAPWAQRYLEKRHGYFRVFTFWFGFVVCSVPQGAVQLARDASRRTSRLGSACRFTLGPWTAGARRVRTRGVRKKEKRGYGYCNES